MNDPIMLSALEKAANKYKKGVAEHGNKGMVAANLTRKQWLESLQEEAIDIVFYCEMLIQMEKDDQ